MDGLMCCALSLAMAPSPQTAVPVPAPAAPVPPLLVRRFTGVDLYGTSEFTVEELRAKLGEEFAAYETAWTSGDVAAAATLEKKLEERVKRLRDFAFARFSVIRYFSAGNPTYLTIDVVEKADAARRMAFAPAPAETLPDPGGILATWAAYEEAGFSLLEAGGHPVDEESHRESFHSVYGFKHEKLAPFKQPILEGAQRHAEELFAILHRDRSEKKRGDAAFLLAFTEDGKRLVAELAPACKDPSSYVRNNALRVYAEIAHFHPDVELPIDVVLDCLDFPETTDRNKASAILSVLSKKAELSEQIVEHAGAMLIAMLRLEQPNNHDFAWMILKNVSGESFGEHDVAAWQQWLDEEQSGLPSRGE